MENFEKELSDLLERTKGIKSPINAAPLGISINEYNMPSEIWMNDVQIFWAKYLWDHTLADKIESLLTNRGLRSYSGLVACLQSISNDKSYIEWKKRNYPKNSKDLLQQLLEQDNPEEYMKCLFKELDQKSDRRLRAMIRDLKEKGYINILWADNIPYNIDFNEKAFMAENESEEGSVEKMNSGTFIYNTITNGNANINSTDNSVKNINITNNPAEVFEKMVNVASNIAAGNKDDIIMAIEEMKNNYQKPTLKDKYFKFIEVAANHMTLFAPFLPMLTEMIK